MEVAEGLHKIDRDASLLAIVVSEDADFKEVPRIRRGQLLVKGGPNKSSLSLRRSGRYSAGIKAPVVLDSLR